MGSGIFPCLNVLSNNFSRLLDLNVTTPKLNNIEPYAYLKDILTRMTNGYPSNQIDDLLPWNWKPQYTVNT